MTHLKNTWIAIAPDRNYTIKEACLYLGVHRCTIYDYILFVNGDDTENPIMQYDVFISAKSRMYQTMGVWLYTNPNMLHFIRKQPACLMSASKR